MGSETGSLPGNPVDLAGLIYSMIFSGINLGRTLKYINTKESVSTTSRPKAALGIALNSGVGVGVNLSGIGLQIIRVRLLLLYIICKMIMK